MILRPFDIATDSEDILNRDLLNRTPYINSLTQIIQNSDAGFTMFLSAGWGKGKTTFVKMWKKHLENIGLNTLYFNAWETDFAKDPLMALLDGLQEGMPHLNTDSGNVIQSGFKTLVGLAKLVPQTQTIAEIIEVIQSGADSLSKENTDFTEYKSYKQLLTSFRNSCAELINEISPNGKLVIFVDELDRCRPNYAVEMLERIKHFFSIDNAIFVISVDKCVMRQAIQGVYNSSQLDADGYLRRFCDLEFILPDPEIQNYVDALYEYHQLDHYIKTHQNGADGFSQKNHDAIKETIKTCFAVHSYSLRDIEKYFNQLDVIVRSVSPSHVPLNVIVYLVNIYQFHNDVFEKIKNREYSFTELLLKLEEILFPLNSDLPTINMSWAFEICAIGMLYGANTDTKQLESEMNNFQFKHIKVSDYANVFRNSRDYELHYDMPTLISRIEFVNLHFDWPERLGR